MLQGFASRCRLTELCNNNDGNDDDKADDKADDKTDDDDVDVVIVQLLV